MAFIRGGWPVSETENGKSAGRVKQSKADKQESSNQKQSNVGSRPASYCLIAYRLCLCHNLQTLPKAQRTQANQFDIFNSSASVFRKREEKSSDRHGKAMIGHVSDKKLSVSGNFLTASVFSY